MSPDRLFDVKAPLTAPFGLFGWIFMGIILGGIPLLGLVTVLATMGASEPGIAAAVAAVCLIPIGILYAVHRMFTRFRLSILGDGAIEFTEPFKTTRIAKDQIAAAHFRSTYVAATKTRMNWLILADASGKPLAAISPVAFGASALNQFVETLKTQSSDIRVTDA